MQPFYPKYYFKLITFSQAVCNCLRWYGILLEKVRSYHVQS